MLRKAQRISIFKIRTGMNGPLNNRLLKRIKYPVSQFFCDDLKTALLNLSRQYILKFYLHASPSSNI